MRTIARVESHGVGAGAAVGALTLGWFAPRPRSPARGRAAWQRYTGPISADGNAVTPTSPGPVCVPITGPISETNSGSRP
jgi:hypothetical protein